MSKRIAFSTWRDCGSLGEDLDAVIYFYANPAEADTNIPDNIEIDEVEVMIPGWDEGRDADGKVAGFTDLLISIDHSKMDMREVEVRCAEHWYDIYGSEE